MTGRSANIIANKNKTGAANRPTTVSAFAPELCKSNDRQGALKVFDPASATDLTSMREHEGVTHDETSYREPDHSERLRMAAFFNAVQPTAPGLSSRRLHHENCPNGA
jgi:hypothetical protein